MIFGSVCSGIEAASVAWHPLGWKTAFLSEIKRFPRAVLQHHYGHTPLHKDFTTIKEHDYAVIDLLVGGTPCQAFSVAGLRKGFADERGNLTLEFIRLAQRLKPRWLVWENVPGVLSIDGGRAFGSFLSGLAECGYGFAYRILDAQHFGVPQRRRRVFVIGYLGDWRPPAAVLFERESLLGNLAPSREKRESFTHDVAPSLTGSGRGVERTGESRGQDPVIAHALRAEGFDASEDGTGRGTPLIPINPYTLAIRGREDESRFEYRQDGLANAILTPNGGRAGMGVGAVAIPINMQATAKNGKKSPNMLGVGKDGDPAPTIGANDIHAVAFSCKDYGADAGDTAPTLRAMGHDGSHANAGGQLAVARSMSVRRLTPTECEGLQGFPDGYTLVPYRGKSAADGPRYKALGNSMAVPCMRWIGERIQMVEDVRA